MPSKPVIGLNADYRPATSDRAALSVINAGYYESILRADGIPLILPLMQDLDDIQAALDRLDGFVLVGGPDLDPRRDGYMLHPSVRTMPSRREDFDRALCQAIADRCMPVLGIGAGMQLLNVTMGGNLYLHLPEDLPDALPHFDPQDPAHRHSLTVTPRSIMERIYGDGEIRVSSQHHMAIDELASCFQVTARCQDGVIEAIESRRPDWFVMGTQFHPETQYASALDIRIFEEFVAGVKCGDHACRLVA